MLPTAASFQGRYFLSPAFGGGTGWIMLLPHLTIQTNPKPSCLLQGLFHFSSFAIGVATGLPQKEWAFSRSTPKHYEMRDHVGWVRTESPPCPPSLASTKTQWFVRDQRSPKAPSFLLLTSFVARVGHDVFADTRAGCVEQH